MLPPNVCCPECRGVLIEVDSQIACQTCEMIYKRKYNIPLLINHDSDEENAIYQDRAHEQAFLDKFVLQDIGKTRTEIERISESDLFTLPASETLNLLGLITGNDRSISILDAGCGYGFYTHELKARGYNVIGCDLSIESLRINHFLHPDLQPDLILCDILKLPFEDASFDFVFCAGVLHHFKDPYKAIIELKRVSKYGILAREPNGSNPVNKLGRLIGRIFLSHQYTGTANERVHSISTYFQLFKKAGFQSIDIKPIFPANKSAMRKNEMLYWHGLMRGLFFFRNMLLYVSKQFLPEQFGGSLLLIKSVNEVSQ